MGFEWGITKCGVFFFFNSRLFLEVFGIYDDCVLMLSWIILTKEAREG